tara:strand:- start:1183 stop:1728 length:546 start_codon:yes stop_codon:yes gene_type:complete
VKKPLVLLSLLGLSFALVVFAFAARYTGLQINVSGSMPYWIWRVASSAPVERGRVVSFCPTLEQTQQQANSASWLSKADCLDGVMPVLKSIAAVTGDQVLVSKEGISVNGKLLQRSARHNNALLRSGLVPEGAYNVEAGQLWLISTYHPSSLDSRYYGPIALGQVEGVYCPWSFSPSDYAC